MEEVITVVAITETITITKDTTGNFTFFYLYISFFPLSLIKENEKYNLKKYKMAF